MILLNGHTLDAKDYVSPETMSLTLEERNSTAVMTLGPDAPEIGINDWLKGDTEPGRGIVWRVKSVNEDVEKKTRTVNLEHIVQSLRDLVMFGEVNAKTITGDDEATECSALAVATYAMALQNEWTLGDFQENPIEPYKFNGESIFSTLELLTRTMHDMQWEYDMSSMPFTLHIREIPTDVDSEMRMSRNISTMRWQIDRSRMYTRIYPIGKENLHIVGDYLSKNENIWGIVSKVETNQTKETEDTLRSWAQERLNRHCDPQVTITVTGLDLSGSTGESLDRLTIGRRCRIPLPDRGAVITERITRLSWADVIKEPEKFTVTLANNMEDIATIMNQIQEAIASGSGGGGGRYGAKKSEDDHAWFVDTNEHVGLVAEAVAGPGADQDWSRVASIFVDGNGIHQRVTQAQADIVENESKIEQTENMIQSEVMRASSEEGMLRSQIIQTASMIYSSVEANNSQIYSEVIQTANEIRSQVSNALSDFYTAIIQTASSVVIRTGDSTKTFHQRTAPTGTTEEPLVDGDLWFDGLGQFTWGDVAEKTWIENTEFDWGEVGANNIYRYDGTTDKWVQVSNERALMQDTRFEANKERISTVAARVDVIDGQVYSYRAEFQVEADQIRSRMTESHNQMESQITQTASQIRAEVSNAASELRSSITVEANRISLVVEGYGANAHIKPASIVAAINNGESSIVISANHVNLDGYVRATDITTNYLSAKLANFSSLTSERGGISVYSVGTTNFTQGGVSCYVPNGIWALRLLPSGNTYTLQRQRFNDDGWTDVGSFSRATTLAGTWSGGTFTASASPQGNSISTGLFSIANADVSWDGKIANIPVYANLSGGETRYYTGKTLTLDTTRIYNEGYEDGYEEGYDAGGSGYTYVGSRELGYMDHGNFESVGYHAWYYK